MDRGGGSKWCPVVYPISEKYLPKEQMYKKTPIIDRFLYYIFLSYFLVNWVHHGTPLGV